MGWLKYSGVWINFVLNPYHWDFDFEFGGLGLPRLLQDDVHEDFEFFWLQMLFGPFNIRIVIDDGKQEPPDSHFD